MIAKAIHSYHSERPFVKINCPAIPDSLFESELFGYQKGAFTGATTSFPGRAKAADDGTLFLDEIADLPKQVQPKLLRLLEEKCFEPLGSNKTIRINTRILCATNRNLKDLVGEGDFRKDLFFRINTVTLDIPPLRKRLEDIEPLSDYFLSRFTSELGRKNMKLSNEVLEAFHRYSWPGNVRELRNVIERAVILSSEEMIALADVTDDITASNSHGIEVGSVLETQERRLLMQALRKFDFNTAAAARELGISRYTMRYRMKKYGIGAG
jgi:transcriptional regulator with PAS, ATPase and Fis domain